MKKRSSRLFGLLLLAFAFHASQGWAKECPEEKMYLKPKSVHLVKNEIVVSTKAGSRVVPKISSDGNGLFVYRKDLKQGKLLVNGRGNKRGGPSSKRPNGNKGGAEHRTNMRPSNENKHQEGRSRAAREQGKANEKAQNR